MANVYARVAKITNVVGRSKYINDEERQEEIVIHKENMLHSWAVHSTYEREHKKTNVANNEALEVHIALPNTLAKDQEKLENVCDDLAIGIVGENKDYEYSVHWNHKRTNLHVHILFSERENQNELEAKFYKKDIWHDKDTHKLAKANAVNAILVHKKGEVQKDKDGNIRYKTDIFKSKDIKYIQKDLVNDIRNITKDVLKNYGYQLDITTYDSPYLAQKKLYKGASVDYTEKAKEWNKAVREYNENVREHILIEPIQYENYIDIKKEVLNNVIEANSEEHKITTRAIELIKDMTSWVKDAINNLKTWYMTKMQENDILYNFEETKNKFKDLFKERNDIQKQKSALEDDIREMNNMDHHLEELIQDTNKTIDDLLVDTTINYDNGFSM